ncbi:hypothetical protein [Vibrio sinaloensis]
MLKFCPNWSGDIIEQDWMEVTATDLGVGAKVMETALGTEITGKEKPLFL